MHEATLGAMRVARRAAAGPVRNARKERAIKGVSGAWVGGLILIVIKLEIEAIRNQKVAIGSTSRVPNIAVDVKKNILSEAS